MRVKADEHVDAAGAGEAPGLGVERAQVGQVLVDQARDDEVVGGRRKAGVGHVGLDEAGVDLARAGHVEHLGREVDAVDRGDAALAQPRPGPARAAAQIGGALDARPRDGAERLEEMDVHRVLDGLLVGGHPLAVAAADVDRPVPACVEGLEIRHTY